MPYDVWDYGTYSDPNQGGNDSTTIGAKLWNWDPTCTVGCFTDVPLTIPNSGGATIVSAGHSFLDDGRLLVTGGTYLPPPDTRGPFINYAFNSATSTWQTNLRPLTANVCDPPNPNNPDCIGGRYYPTNVTVKSPLLNEAHVLSVHGLNNDASAPNRSVERYSPSTNEWFVDSRPLIPINPLQAQYPWLHVLPAASPTTVLFSGHFDGGSNSSSRFAHKYRVENPLWESVGAARNDHKHASGTSVLLAVVDPAVGGDGGRLLIAGGANAFDAGITASAKLLCIAPVQHARCPGSEGWQIETAMSYARQHLDGVILPDEKVVILGGESAGGCDPLGNPPPPPLCPGQIPNQCVPVYHAELYDPAVPWPNNPWTVVDPPPPGERRPRQYHSIKFLLPNGSVLMAGGNTDERCFPLEGPSAQIYKPGYFFRGPRPRINAMALPREVAYDQAFTVTIDQNVVTGGKVVLLRAGSVTHGFNFDQRLVELRTVGLAGPSTLRVQAPSNANVAPPGFYLLFFVQPSPQGPLPSQLGEFIKVRF